MAGTQPALQHVRNPAMQSHQTLAGIGLEVETLAMQEREANLK